MKQNVNNDVSKDFVCVYKVDKLAGENSLIRD